MKSTLTKEEAAKIEQIMAKMQETTAERRRKARWAYEDQQERKQLKEELEWLN